MLKEVYFLKTTITVFQTMYETQYHCETPSQNYAMDQYNASNDSNSNSPSAESNASHKPRDDFPTPSTDVSNEGDDSCSSLNYQYNRNNLNLNDPSNCKLIFLFNKNCSLFYKIYSLFLSKIFVIHIQRRILIRILFELIMYTKTQWTKMPICIILNLKKN